MGRLKKLGIGTVVIIVIFFSLAVASVDSPSTKDDTILSNPTNEIKDDLQATKYGFKNIQCIREQFGFVTIIADYYNDSKHYDVISITGYLYDSEGFVVNTTPHFLFDVNPHSKHKFSINTIYDDKYSKCQIIINYKN